MPIYPTIPNAQSLVTNRANTTAGFIRMALERSRRATPYVEEARALQAAATALPTVQQLLTEPTLQKALLTAAGVSDKATKFFTSEERQLAVAEFVEKYLAPVSNYSEELAFRFLLTRGDTLGGAMRNVVGRLGEEHLLRAVLAALRLRQVPVTRLLRTAPYWQPLPPAEEAPERDAQALAWTVAGQPRVLLLNQTVPVVNKNIDLILLHTDPEQLATAAQRKITLLRSENYLAFGELKGGFDPSGSDEHWKTARTAFGRIRQVHPTAALFFVGGAIVTGMAAEIWSQLQAGDLRQAANLTHDDQVFALSNWLVSL